MKTWLRYLLSIASAAFVASCVAYAVAKAETCTLEIKRLDSQNGMNASDYIYRSTSPQRFIAQAGPEGKSNISFAEQEEQAANFKKIVKKEPQYESEHPFRGVVKLGSQQYAFALDEVVPESEKKKAESGKKDSEPEPGDAEKDGKGAKTSVAKGLFGALLHALPFGQGDDTTIKVVGYNRLYFDINHNGDLTDDRVIETETEPNPGIFREFDFPRVDLTIDADGTPVDYSFFLNGYVIASREFSYAVVQINAAAYRQGDITLDGKKRHVVLIDYNSNGRFDDEIKISDDALKSGGALYPEEGDMLLIDPNQGKAGYTSPYDVTSNAYQHYVSKMVDIDGRYYNLKISPAGDKLTLDPVSAQLGKITNPNARFTAVIYGENGFLKISGEKDAPISIPAGQWKLLSYTIDLTNPAEQSKAAEKDEEESGISALGMVVESLLGVNPPVPPGRRYSIVTANATAKYQPVKVAEGETVVFPFGPPYKPTVTIDGIQGEKDNKQVSLGMTLVGSVGEAVSNMMVNGGRPPKPDFTIKDPKGDLVQSGSFEYG